jgi:hypothetical protein
MAVTLLVLVTGTEVSSSGSFRCRSQTPLQNLKHYDLIFL